MTDSDANKCGTVPSNSGEGLTYHPTDFVEFLDLIDPNLIDPERLVKSLSRASAGVDAAKRYVREFVRFHRARLGQDPFDIEDEMEVWWENAANADDLRDIALEQAARLSEQTFDWRVSCNHPNVISDAVEALEQHSESLHLWAKRPRQDERGKIKKEAARVPWPTRLNYEHKHGAKNARFFLARRPFDLISSDGRLYSYQDGIWVETSDQSIAAEIRKTDPVDFLDVDQVRKVTQAIHHSRSVNARPFEWINQEYSNPDPKDLVLYRNGLLNIQSGELLRLDGDYFATGLPNHDYNPLADCPLWMDWLDETLDPSFHDTVQEWFGYCLTPDTRAE